MKETRRAEGKPGGKSASERSGTASSSAKSAAKKPRSSKSGNGGPDQFQDPHHVASRATRLEAAIGREVRSFRHQLGMTVTQLAKEVGFAVLGTIGLLVALPALTRAVAPDQAEAALLVALGIGIVLVVMGHNDFAHISPFAHKYIYSFHMLMFFFMSGMFFKPNLPLWTFIRNRYHGFSNHSSPFSC